jgi:hypothetical protein
MAAAKAEGKKLFMLRIKNSGNISPAIS